MTALALVKLLIIYRLNELLKREHPTDVCVHQPAYGLDLVTEVRKHLVTSLAAGRPLRLLGLGVVGIARGVLFPWNNTREVVVVISVMTRRENTGWPKLGELK